MCAAVCESDQRTDRAYKRERAFCSITLLTRRARRSWLMSYLFTESDRQCSAVVLYPISLPRGRGCDSDSRAPDAATHRRPSSTFAWLRCRSAVEQQRGANPRVDLSGAGVSALALCISFSAVFLSAAGHRARHDRRARHSRSCRTRPVRAARAAARKACLTRRRQRWSDWSLLILRDMAVPPTPSRRCPTLPSRAGAARGAAHRTALARAAEPRPSTRIVVVSDLPHSFGDC